MAWHWGKAGTLLGTRFKFSFEDLVQAVLGDVSSVKRNGGEASRVGTRFTGHGKAEANFRHPGRGCFQMSF